MSRDRDENLPGEEWMTYMGWSPMLERRISHCGLASGKRIVRLATSLLPVEL